MRLQNVVLPVHRPRIRRPLGQALPLQVWLRARARIQGPRTRPLQPVEWHRWHRLPAVVLVGHWGHCIGRCFSSPLLSYSYSFPFHSLCLTTRLLVAHSDWIVITRGLCDTVNLKSGMAIFFHLSVSNLQQRIASGMHSVVVSSYLLFLSFPFLPFFYR